MVSDGSRSAETTPMFSDKLLACLKAPGAGEEMHLEAAAGGLRCPRTGAEYPYVDGVPTLFQAPRGDGEEISVRVKSFYEENPFPDYEGVEDFGDLVGKGNTNSFSRRLLGAIGYNKLVLECGCGTGQLSHFLQLNNNQVLGVDMSLSSLKLALEHKMRNQLERSAFAQMNIFDLAIRDSFFDVVIAHGVLHHTFDAHRAFDHIVRKVKPGGIVIVGLYNRYARVATWVRAGVVRVLGPRVDYVVRHRIRDARKADTWIKDQYFNPHETWHSIGEVLGWFADNDVEFLNCSPPILGAAGEDAPGLFDPTDSGTPYQRAITQLSWLGTIAREGSLFDLIGRRGG